MTGMVTVGTVDRLVIDERSSEPSYAQLARQLRDRIRAGQYEPGGRLPSISTLTGETGLAVNTVRHALSVLADEGWAVIVPGRGTFAAEKPPE
jgi:DNA-binding GntR family transcriptional regulator